MPWPFSNVNLLMPDLFVRRAYTDTGVRPNFESLSNLSSIHSWSSLSLYPLGSFHDWIYLTVAAHSGSGLDQPERKLGYVFSESLPRL